MTVTLDQAITVLNASEVMRQTWHALPDGDSVSVKIVSALEGDVAGFLLVEPDGGIEPHVHDRGVHHMYVLEGRCWVGGTLLVEGAYVRVPAGVEHSLRGGGPTGCRLFYVASGGAVQPPANVVRLP